MKLHFRGWDNLIFQIFVNGILLLVLLIISIPIWRVLIMSMTPLGYMDDQPTVSGSIHGSGRSKHTSSFSTIRLFCGQPQTVSLS